MTASHDLAAGAGGRRLLVSGNWKMHHDHDEAVRYATRLVECLRGVDTDRVEVSLHPSFTGLLPVRNVLMAKGVPVALGAQNCHFEDEGSFTGEVSPIMLAKLGVRYVVVGHSERRQLFAEDDETVNRKVHAVLRHKLVPILCVGETPEERAAGTAHTRVSSQVRVGLAEVDPGAIAGVVIAYEPLWAIGSGQVATPDDAQEMAGTIRSVVRGIAGDAAATLRVQYGGSVTADDAASLLAQPDVDGALIGGASLDPESFAAIVAVVAQADAKAGI